MKVSSFPIYHGGSRGDCWGHGQANAASEYATKLISLGCPSLRKWSLTSAYSHSAAMVVLLTCPASGSMSPHPDRALSVVDVSPGCRCHLAARSIGAVAPRAHTPGKGIGPMGARRVARSLASLYHVLIGASESPHMGFLRHLSGVAGEFDHSVLWLSCSLPCKKAALTSALKLVHPELAQMDRM